MRARVWLPPLLVVLLLLGLWQLAASSGFLADVLGLEDFLVPSPSEIADIFWQDRSLISSGRYFSERPLQLSRVLDALLASPEWGARIPTERIGAVGHSAGG